MEEDVASSTKIVDEKQKELKTFKKCFIVFLVGQILLIISTLSHSTIINGVPRWFSIFELLMYITYILYLFAVFPMRKYNQSFNRAFISLLALYIVDVFYEVCRTSESQFYVSASRGLNWSIDLVKCIFYLFFFHGCALFFDKYNLHAGKKKTIILLTIFLVLFALSEIFDYLSGTALLRRNRFFNRFFLYGSWGFSFLVYTFIFVMTNILAHFLNKKFRKRKENADEIQVVSD